MLIVAKLDPVQLMFLMKRYKANYKSLYLFIKAECYINFRWHFLKILLLQTTPQKRKIHQYFKIKSLDHLNFLV